MSAEKTTALAPSELRALAARPTAAAAKPPATSFRALLEGTRGAARDGETSPAPIAKSGPRGDREPEVGDRPRRPRPLGERRDEDAGAGLAAFRPPSAILAPPPAGPARPAVGSAVDRAEAAALAERLVTGLRVGRVGRDGHVVQLRIRGAGADLEVRLRHEHGRLGIVLAARDARGLEDAGRISRALEGELAARGVTLDAIEVEDAR